MQPNKIFWARKSLLNLPSGGWWFFKEFATDSTMEAIRTFFARWSVTMFLWNYILSHSSIIIVLVFAGLTIWGYADYKKSNRNNTESPIKGVSPSLTNLTLEFSQFVINIEDDRFRVTTSVGIEIENNTDHVIKITQTNLILLFGKRYSIQSLLYRKSFADGREGSLQKYPIVIEPYSTRRENMFRIDYLDVININRKFINTPPKKSWVYFELVGVKNTKEYHPIDMGIDVKWNV